jgi:Integrase core domain
MRRTFDMTDIVEIMAHWYAGRSYAQVARSLGIDRGTVVKYTAPARAEGIVPGGPPISEEAWREKARGWFPKCYDKRLCRRSWADIAPHHDRIAELVKVVPASVAYQRLADEAGLAVSPSSFRRYLRAHFDQVRPEEVVIWRPPVRPGEEAQVDYGYLGTWQDPGSGQHRRVWAFSMVLSYSRHLFMRPVLRMDQASWAECHVAAFGYFSGAVARVVLDNLRAGVIKPDLYDPKLNRSYAELGAYYNVLLDPARAFHPKDKPRVESLQKYIRTSFFAGREFTSFAEMLSEARRWCTEVAGRRAPRALEGRTPLETFVAEEASALQPLPVMPFELATWSRPKVGPDAHAQVGKTLYSVPWRLIGKRLDARATPELVRFYLDGEVVKTHPAQGRGRRTDWADLPDQRVSFFMRTPAWCRSQAAMVGPATRVLVDELLSVNALFRLRQAQGVLRLGQSKGDARLEAACRRALEAGDPSYQTVKGILAAGTEAEAQAPPLPGALPPAWLHGPEAFSTLEQR